MVKRYVDFELQLSLDEEQVIVDVNGRPHGINLPHPLRIPLPALSCTPRALTQASTLRLHSNGFQLYKSFFVSEVEFRLQAYLNRRSHDEGVRICICSDSSSLSESKRSA